MREKREFILQDPQSFSKKRNDPSHYVPPSIRWNPFLVWAYQKVHTYNEDCIIGISGKTGSGKTTLAAKLSEILDVDYNGKTRFPAKVIELKKNKDGKIEPESVLVPRLVNRISTFEKIRSKKWPVGTAIIIDEAQVLMNSRDFNTKKNKAVLRHISTGRVFRMFIFIVLPYWENLDSQLKNYLHAVIRVYRPDRVRRKSLWTPYYLQPVGYLKPPLTIKYRYWKKNRLRFLDECKTSLPSYDLWKAQEKKVNLWKQMISRGEIDSAGELIDPNAKKNSKRERTLARREEARKVRLDRAEKLASSLRSRRSDVMMGGKYNVAGIMTLLQETRDMSNLVAAVFRRYDEEEKAGVE